MILLAVGHVDERSRLVDLALNVAFYGCYYVCYPSSLLGCKPKIVDDGYCFSGEAKGESLDLRDCRLIVQS